MSQFINYTLTVRNQGEIVPKVEGHESKHGHFDRKQRKHIEFCLKKLRDNKLDGREDFSYFGNSLFEALLKPVEVSFSGEVWKQLTQLETTHLRIRIVFEEVDEPTELASQIINLPWEFLCYPDDNNTFLGTHPRVALSYGYQTWLKNPLEGYAVRESPLRMLFVHGHPSKLPDVGFVSLVQKILTELGESVEVKKLKNPTPDKLSEALSKKPHVLHFLGHGQPGALALGDLPNGETSWLEDQSLSDFLRAGGVKLVVLQACEGASPSEELAFTGTAAQLVKTHIPAVIAIRYPISQSLAWNFVRTLYDKLAAGEPVDVAVQAGRAQLARGNQSHASRDFGAPVLWMHLRDGLLFATGDITPKEEEEKEAEPFTDETGKVICPYQGLNAFIEETKQFFFGRVRKVEEIEQRLNERNFVSVIGASGSGKSSVVLAGLIPRLKNLGDWEILPSIRPGDEPIAKLKNVFEPYFPKSKKELTLLNDFLKKEPPNLQGLVDRLPGSESFLLVVDQFEELFTLCCNEDQQKQFIKLLCQVPTQSRLSVVITLRADFVVACLNDSDLTQLIKDPVFMPSLEGANLEAAIVKPAQRQRYALEGGLLGEILEDVAKEKGILPLLEFALTQLWEKRDPDRHLLTRKGYEAIGGVIGALNRHADELYGQFDSQEQEWTRKIFYQLLQIGEGTKDTRKRQSKQNLLSMVEDNEADREALSEVLERLVDGRLLLTEKNEQDKEAWVDLAHEALIESWGKLNKWRQESREVRELAERIEKAKQAWDYYQEDSNYLLDGILRKEAYHRLQELDQLGISAQVLAFVEQSFAVWSFETEIDYRPLDRLLKAQEWQEADDETFRVMLKAMKAEKNGSLYGTDFAQFPCQDLRIINKLWLRYSNGKFGFSVQKEIYESLGGTTGTRFNDDIWKKFGDRVGWRKGDNWLSYYDLTFDKSAPQAHLPYIYLMYDLADRSVLIYGKGNVYNISTSPTSILSLIPYLTHRLVTCNI